MRVVPVEQMRMLDRQAGVGWRQVDRRHLPLHQGNLVKNPWSGDNLRCRKSTAVFTFVFMRWHGRLAREAEGVMAFRLLHG